MALSEIDDKKVVLLYLEKILKNETDYTHPLTYAELIEIISNRYHIVVERRTIGRCIELLKRSGMDIISTKKGSYVNSRDFEDTELRLLIDGVLASKYIAKNHSKELIDKLSSLSNNFFQARIDHVQSNFISDKSDNKNLFLNIELVDEAISNDNQVSFDFYKYGVDKKLYKSASHIVSPCEMILHNQKYYLMAINEKYKTVSFYRVDHIKKMKIIKNSKRTPLKEIPGYEKGVNYKELCNRPYLYSDRDYKVEFIADDCIIDQIVDWFGSDVNMVRLDQDSNKVKCDLNVSLKAMEIWAMQYLNHVEIIKPDYLRDKVKQNVLDALEKYN